MHLRFSIRDLLWLTLVVGLLLAWWLEHRKVQKMIEREQTVQIMISKDDVVRTCTEFATTCDSIAAGKINGTANESAESLRQRFKNVAETNWMERDRRIAEIRPQVIKSLPPIEW